MANPLPPPAQKKRRQLFGWSILPYTNGQLDSPHIHADQGQLKWVEGGVLSVPTPQGIFVAPPGWAIWIPPGHLHGGLYRGECINRNVFVVDNECTTLPTQASLVKLSTTLSQALQRSMEDRDAYAPPPTLEDHQRIIRVLQQELEDSKRRPVALPLEVSEQLQPLFNALTRDPADSRTLADWATILHLSRRTFTRLVHSKAGMSFTQLRSRIRFLHALQELSVGQEVRAVATELGYKTVSAFVVRFREEFGVTPGRYFT